MSAGGFSHSTRVTQRRASRPESRAVRLWNTATDDGRTISPPDDIGPSWGLISISASPPSSSFYGHMLFGMSIHRLHSRQRPREHKILLERRKEQSLPHRITHPPRDETRRSYIVIPSFEAKQSVAQCSPPRAPHMHLGFYRPHPLAQVEVCLDGNFLSSSSRMGAWSVNSLESEPVHVTRLGLRYSWASS